MNRSPGLPGLTLLALALMVLGWATPSQVAAQDGFDDEFADEEFADDEFADDESDLDGEDGFDDSLDDETFDDEPLDDETFDDEEDFGDAEDGSDTTEDDASVERIDENTTVTERVISEGGGRVRDPDWERRYRHHLTYDGPVGGIHVIDAGSGAVGSLRLQLGTEFFYTKNFLIEGDDHDHIGGAFVLSWTPHRMIEVWASIFASSNANNAEDPDLFQVIGDTEIGIKVFHEFSDLLRIGGDFRLRFLNGVGDVGLGLRSTGIGLRASLAVDLRGLDSPVPLIARLNLGYYFDNSARLIEGIEQQRYDRLPDPEDPSVEGRHLITPVERYGMGVNRVDTMRIGLGFEAPIEISETFHISPILEWTWNLAMNRQNYSCLYLEGPDGGEPVGGADSCLRDEGYFPALPMSISLGVRVQPGVRGLSLFAGADIGITGTSLGDNVRELASNEPYKIMLAASYAFDARPREPRVVLREIVREIETPYEAPVEGHVRGIVMGTGDEPGPVAGAVVRYDGVEEGGVSMGQVTDANGRFVSFPLPSGQVRMTVEHPDYETGQSATTLDEEGNDVEVRCDIERRLVVIQEDEIQILQQIHFATARSEILPQSFPLMRQIASTINNHPEIARLEIQGHTDDIGSLEYNQQLSQARADSVMAWLTENGNVEAGRLTAVGYAYNRPLVPNNSDENRAQNRRVQFVIMQRDEPPAE